MRTYRYLSSSYSPYSSCYHYKSRSASTSLRTAWAFQARRSPSSHYAGWDWDGEKDEELPLPRQKTLPNGNNTSAQYSGYSRGRGGWRGGGGDFQLSRFAHPGWRGELGSAAFQDVFGSPRYHLGIYLKLATNPITVTGQINLFTCPLLGYIYIQVVPGHTDGERTG